MKKYNLTKEQSEIVLLNREDILIKGIAGSGKTLVLLYKAKKLAEENPNEKVIIFTYNKTLKKSSEEIIRKLNLPNLEVATFHSWAYKALIPIIKKKIYVSSYKDNFLLPAINAVNNSHRFVTDEKYIEFLKDEIAWIKGKGIFSLEEYLSAQRLGRGTEIRVVAEDRKVIFEIYSNYEKYKDYKIEYNDFAPTLFKNKENILESHKFDHIFVDEAQDLQQIQLQLLKNISNKTFFVAADTSQKIYKTYFTWKDIGINIVGGGTKVLKGCFRSTKEILSLAHSIQSEEVKKNEDYIEPELPEISGPIPVLFKCLSVYSQDALIIKNINSILESDKAATIGILFRSWGSSARLKSQLSKEKIVFEEIRENDGSSHTPGVKLTTFHSAKGLEFDYVFVIDLTNQNLKNEIDLDFYWETERKLLYVTLTRAKYYLQMYTYGDYNSLIDELNKELYIEKSE
ncbi:UvrD-helicase domain-containing protein [Cetobacterium sp.]|uniref:UvrD-helicase domain-containing protein n=1 Tax=Cetobacterium sp. TaxID=2071632 RepID=UPI003F3E3A49